LNEPQAVCGTAELGADVLCSPVGVEQYARWPAPGIKGRQQRVHCQLRVSLGGCN
jgi:hypothetical protein